MWWLRSWRRAGSGASSFRWETRRCCSRCRGFAEFLDRGRLLALNSKESPSRSTLAALDDLEDAYPLLVTTADHALLAPRMVRTFCDAASAGGCDLAAALVSEAVVRAGVPETKRTYLAFRDGRFSGANLFAFMTPKGRAAAAFWRHVEQERKRPWRIAKAFGWGLLAAYVLRVWTLEQAMSRAAARIGVTAQAVPLPYAEAAIDGRQTGRPGTCRKTLDQTALKA